MSHPNAKHWIELGNWGSGMDEFKLPSSNELAGKGLELHFKGSSRVTKYLFHDARSLTWQIITGAEAGQSGCETYEAIRVAPEIYFVDFVKKAEPNVSLSMALDLDTRMATLLIATIPDKNVMDQGFIDRVRKSLDLSTIKVEILHADIDPGPGQKIMWSHKRTRDLIGKRVKYTYSRHHVYEHIYLNDRFFTWHCLDGIEKGLADTEMCDYFKIAQDVYLFSWREKVMPTFGAVLINFKEMTSNGKTFGLDVSTQRIMNFTMGSIAEVVSETRYS